MRVLLDTNIFLEVILEQADATSAEAVLGSIATNELFVSDFTIHSIGLLLFRRGRTEVFESIVQDLMAGGISPLTVPWEHVSLIAEAARKFHLDFDDAYQYAVARLYDTEVVSFDGDFDRTDRGRKTPSQVVS